ncbi:MFS transporter [Modestobacter italicus]|uniref:MFS transporter n=1 Tax=Modestobacter italicus (strain DSM 44449 / CECT 9708 / BC 501) TaxID=2732864 RepID=UPI001C97DFF1|nr:MFS transporter [Modestobacter italicus]
MKKAVGAVVADDRTTSARRSSSPRIAVGTLCAVQFVDVLGTTIVISAAPAMLADLGAPPSAVSVVVPAYAVFFGALLMLGARLGDRFGHRRVLQAGLLLFATASLAAAAAPGLVVLVAARCTLGAAAALSVPTALRLLSAVTEEEDARRGALAAWSASGAAAGAAGLLLGGVLTDAVGWRSLFWVNLPLAAVLLVTVRRHVPTPAPRRAGSLDVPGGLLLAVAVAALVLGASVLERPGRALTGGAALAVALAAAAWFARVERRATDPLVPAAALRHRALSTGAAASLANTAATSSAVTVATVWLQDTQGRSPTAAGLTLLPFSLLVVVGAASAKAVMRRRTPRTTAGLGLVVVAAGNALLLGAPSWPWLVPVAVAISGLGLGLSSVAATTEGTAVPEQLQGTAAGLLNTAAQLGTAVGVAAVLLLATASEGTGVPLAGPPSGWAASAVIALATAWWLLRRRDE